MFLTAEYFSPHLSILLQCRSRFLRSIEYTLFRSQFWEQKKNGPLLISFCEDVISQKNKNTRTQTHYPVSTAVVVVNSRMQKIPAAKIDRDETDGPVFVVANVADVSTKSDATRFRVITNCRRNIKQTNFRWPCDCIWEKHKKKTRFTLPTTVEIGSYKSIVVNIFLKFCILIKCLTCRVCFCFGWYIYRRRRMISRGT